MRKALFNLLANLAEKHSGKMIIVALVITIITGGLAGNLDLRMQFKNMMPQNHPTVKEFDKIVTEFSTASNIIIAVKGDEASIKSFAEEIVPEVKKLEHYVKRVTYKNDIEFYKKYGLLLTKAKDLKNSRGMYSDLSATGFLRSINNNLERTYVGDSESISNKEKENRAITSLDGIDYWIKTFGNYIDKNADDNTAKLAVDRILLGDEYFISQDKDMLMIFVQPTFNVNEVEKTVNAVNEIEAIINEKASAYINLDAGLAGTMALMRDEMVAASEDMFSTSLGAFLLIILLFIISFRMWTAPILAGISLILGVVWTSGFAAVSIGSLNMMTSMFGVVLIGLGIDFNIHIISSYTEYRAEGNSIYESLVYTFTKSGNGIIIGAITTSVAFLTMMVSENAGMNEFGLIAGSGVLFCMIAALLVLPSLLVIREKMMSKVKKEQFQPKSTSFEFLGNTAERFSRYPKAVLFGSVIVTILLLISATKITFNYDYLSLEPEGLKSVELQDDMIDEFDISPDMVLVTTSTVEESRKLAEEAKDLKSVGMVTSISDYIPSAKQVEKRSPYIDEVRKDLANKEKLNFISSANLDEFLEELYRLEDNIIELAQLAFTGGQDKVDLKAKSIIGDLDLPIEERKNVISGLISKIEKEQVKSINAINEFQKEYEPYLRESVLEMSTVKNLSVADLPSTIEERFLSNDKKSYLLSIYPKQQAWDIAFLERFSNQMHKIDERVTGMPLIFYILVIFIGKDGTLAAILTLIVVFLLLLFDFKSLKLSLMALIPLIIGAVWMVGIMQLVGMQLDIMNVIGIPLILGIGIDDGVHILHRYKIEGNKKIKLIFSSTGKAVLLTTITTMLAFGSLGFAVMRGLASMGIALFIGVGTVFLTSVIILPAIMGLIKDKRSE